MSRLHKFKIIWNQWFTDGFPTIWHWAIHTHTHTIPTTKCRLNITLSISCVCVLRVCLRFFRTLDVYVLLKHSNESIERETKHVKSFSFTAVATAVTWFLCCCWCCKNKKHRTWHDSFNSKFSFKKMDGNQYINRFQQVETRFYSFYEPTKFILFLLFVTCIYEDFDVCRKASQIFYINNIKRK